ncbi:MULTISPECIES: hypothetical protein [unclassified Kitasatospora]|uniref:hypothetical protein n=1 Tax=unclassified Kitasatospora TaxID=2633591 RepID=UPI00380C54F1
MKRTPVKVKPRTGSARNLLVIPAAALLASGCTSAPETSSAGQGEDRRLTAAATTPAQVRTDVEPLKRRFPQLGELSATKWVGRVLTKNSVPEIPGPTDVSLDGVAQVDPATLTAITGSGTWREGSIGCGVPQEIAPKVGDTTVWLHSEAFDKSVTQTQYTGSFYFDKQTNRVYFCTVNPKERTS